MLLILCKHMLAVMLLILCKHNMDCICRFGLADIPWLQRLLANLTDETGTQINGHILSLMGFQFANSFWPPRDYFIDSAFTGGARLTPLLLLLSLLMPPSM